MRKRQYKNRVPKSHIGICLALFLLAMTATAPLCFSKDGKDKFAIQREFTRHLNRANVYYKKKMYKKAIDEWQKAATLKPHNEIVEKLIAKANKRVKKKFVFLHKEEYTERKQYIPGEKRKLILDECISIAMDNHLPLDIAKKQLRLAEFRLLEARRKRAPAVTVKMEEETGMVTMRKYTGSRIQVEGKQPIFYGGELIFSVKQAKTNVEIVKNDYDRIKNDLILQVKKAFYHLDKAKKVITMQVKLNTRTRELYDISKAGYKADIIAQVEFFKVNSQHNQTGFQVISAKEDLSVAHLLLQQAMNIDEEIEIARVSVPKIIKLQLGDCFDLAYLNRPEIKNSILSLEYYEYEKKIREARAFWPRVDLLGMYGNSREDYVQADMNENDVSRTLGPEYYFGGKVSLPIWGSTLSYSYTKEKWQPIVRSRHETQSVTHVSTFSLFDKLEDLSGVQEVELEYMRSQDAMNKKKQEIALEVKETFFKYKKAILLMAVAKSKVNFQAKQVEFFEVRRMLGEAQNSDVIEEMIKLSEEKFSYIQAITDYCVAIAALNKAIGIDGYFNI